VITLITVQNTRKVSRVEVLDPELIAQQITAVLEDIPPLAAKTGALGNREVVRMIAQMASEFRFPLVVDPVMISKHGTPLLSSDAQQAFRDFLLPHAYLVMPNLHEAEALTGHIITNVPEMRQAAEQLHSFGARSVLVKGGHLERVAVDVLLHEGQFYEFSAERIETPHTHGTGCTFSSAITAELAKGASLPDAVKRAKQFVTEAIRTNPGLGHGSGPLNHHVASPEGIATLR
ncbi:MAG TPA: bifunctional hydroxymethylpyrimidine kinase/phosphomethylpyrimidine kinase, partial [Bryobacteraceae bacterium]|jgi:hydroxymethylpyrimidine/phosphomethylpyrimidine kinase|nr:bifunctional hydroxymethylpyrimidine kinase/phosphomethylpyrimidine kinase [Bryobacteraceae bacterium]